MNIDNQEKLLNILINNPSFIDHLEDYGITDKHFDLDLLPIYYAIRHFYVESAILTANGYEDFVDRAISNGDFEKWTKQRPPSKNMVLGACRSKFIEIAKTTVVDKNDFHVIANNIKNDHIQDQTIKIFEEFNKNKSTNFVKSLRVLADKADSLIEDSVHAASNLYFLDDYIGDYINLLKERKENPEKKIKTGIKEIDDSMAVGLKPGTLTLFAADVGGFKSTMMFNIALNVYNKYKENVMIVSLEMPREMVTSKIIAREASIETYKLENSNLLTQLELDKILKHEKLLKEASNKLVIFDPEDRTTVSSIRRAIEKSISFYKPRVVVIDYISILKPEDEYAKQNQNLWYGHMCKDIRSMGKKYGFAAISAVQLGRDALKRLRTQKQGKQSVGSEDLRGSHDFSADADNIYAQVPHPDQPNEKLMLFCIKARYGSKMFGKSNYTLLDVKPDKGIITGCNDAIWESNNDSMIKDVKEIVEMVPPPIDSFDDISINTTNTSKKVTTGIIDDIDSIFAGPAKKNKDHDFSDD